MIIDRDNIKILLVLLIVGLGLGYAYINSDLNINGTAQVNSANWNVHWSNIQITTGSVSGSNVVTQPTISNQTTVNYSIILPQPGDYYEFTIDAANSGTIDAMIDSLDSKLNGVTISTLPVYLKYSVTYVNDEPLQNNQQLLHNTTETYKVRVEYNDDIDPSRLPASNQTLSLSLTVNYRQANDAAIPVDHAITVYTGNSDYDVVVGESIPNSITQYSTSLGAREYFQQDMNWSELPSVYLKHKVEEGIVRDTYAEFVITPEMVNMDSNLTAGIYSFKWINMIDENSPETNYCKSEYYDSTNNLCMNPMYEEYKTALSNIFGSSNCYEANSFPTYYNCYSSGVGMNVEEASSAMYASDGELNCGTAHNGHSYCGWRSMYY